MLPIAAFVNHVLAQHPWARDKLAPHAGKTMRVEAPPLALSFTIDAAGDIVSSPLSQSADVSFRINAAQIPLMLADPDTALKSVQLSGDVEFAQVMAVLMRELRWDAEEDLSRIVGDVPAYRAMRSARAFAAWGRDASLRLAGTTAAFLVDEEPMLVRSDVIEQFTAGVAEARDACARLEKRIEMLETTRRGMSGS